MKSPLEEYVRTAIENGMGLETGDHKRANRAADRNLRALREILKAPDRGKALLATLLTHESPRVRGLAAVDLLREGDTRGVPVLTEIAKDRTLHPIASFSAEIALEEWQKGRLARRA